jgi:hypothetical protein
MNDNIFDGFAWHSAIGFDPALDSQKRFATELKNTPTARRMFTASGDGTLIHKTTRALWRVSDDKTKIVPMFSTDILTEDEIREAMGDTTDES